MFPPGKRSSVTYDAGRIRVPPERLAERHLNIPMDRPHALRSADLRIVSDDVVQRNLQPQRPVFTQAASSPDSFEFLAPANVPSPGSSGTYSPGLQNAQNSTNRPTNDMQIAPPSIPGVRKQGSQSPRSILSPGAYSGADSGPHLVDLTLPYDKPGLTRSMSRIKSQLPPARRYSSYPSTEPAERLIGSTTSPISDGFAAKHNVSRPILPPFGNHFSFSEADDSVLDVSPARTNFSLVAKAYTPPLAARPLALTLALTLASTPTISIPDVVTMPPPPAESVTLILPPKLLDSLNSNAIGLIIGAYDHSLSLLALDARTRDINAYPLQTPAFHNVPPSKNVPETAPEFKQPSHDRQDSQLSAISLASSSTLTSAHTHQQRFVRYVMSTQKSSTHSCRWAMDNVLGWLEGHGFPDNWKETFRRNEISGNRFLELGNYDSASTVWRQLSSTLGVDGDRALVDRFLGLLGAEIQESETALPSQPSQQTAPSFLDVDPYSKLENRKSLSTLWAQTTPTVATKQRPFSYIDPGNPKQLKEHSKFFRKHNRLSSNETVVPPQPSKPAGEASLGLSHLGFKKSGILSTLRKYGGEKAAGIVKQVQSNPTAGKPSHKRMGSGFLNVLQKKDLSQKGPEPLGLNSLGLLPVFPTDESSRSPSSLRSFNVINSDESSATLPLGSSKLSQKLTLEEIVGREFMPVPHEDKPGVGMTILLTRDNNSFVPCRIDGSTISHIDGLKKLFVRKLDMLDIGTITIHLTEFGAKCGPPIPEDLFLAALQLGLVTKVKLEQNFRSPDRIGTFSSTSSDSKSFDTSGGKMYPATPQYLLQHSNDKQVDYMNFKESVRNKAPSKDPDLPPLPLLGPLDKAAGTPYAINLSLPQLKRLQQNNSANPTLNKRGLPLINTSQPHITPHLSQGTESKSRETLVHSATSPNSSFSVVRREGREIDFDKRRLNPTESKAPRLIPNIYSSSVTDSAISPISASTIHAFKDEKASSPETRNRSESQASRSLSTNLELEKGGSFVARRKAPPPPTASNSLKVKRSTNTISSSNYHQSNDSFDSFGSSNLSASGFQGETKTFDFSDAPSLELSDHKDETDDDDDDDVFFKPLAGASKASLKADISSERQSLVSNASVNDSLNESDSMTMRPSVDEVYGNLERYFPNTILDKPIIDAYPESPSVSSMGHDTRASTRKPSISRTFSNANISPVHPEKEMDDQVFYGDGPRLRRRMKTIRAVANEAHKKRLASQRAVKDAMPGRPARRNITVGQMSLTRTNTKLWGQKVVEVTSDDIEKGFVGRIRKGANKAYEEFAWVKGELIGRGSFGSVFLALNVTTGEMLAVKQVNVRENAKSSEGINAFHKEVETMKDLDHINIVQYLGFEQSKQTFSLFLEYVAGGSVSSCLKTYGKFDEPLVKFITRQVLEGLKYLHENGILHRDLKADNLLLEIDGVCKISDFGISKRSQDIYSNNAEMSMQGTVFWMAPEVIHSMVEDKKQGYSAKVDIWSLGCVMLEMFAGQRPWSNEAVISAIYKLGKTKLAPPIPADVSQEAKDFLNKCFTIDSNKRPTAAELLEHDFMRIDSGFQFSQTRLSEIIRSNSTKNMAKR
ncbi:mitogen-activated protein kinase kinase kinase [Metschnikowia aff. pulcherrima]|uniref:Mitogen-activated protein kinase kinase kinase n=1 Tax=Metschnikowia aff. pulcherrima TaxID=2163413 RepID=A0A4P6XEE3_9ASCO|nr:mitogen-activated protein kinase kinase kinase [Metschnikowia aff. pulcherrima]